jgi:surface polysaccharide O-acyltransferase-like enzyme
VISRLTVAPAAGHFWYVRDLMAFVMLAPLFCLVYRRRWLAGIVLASLLLSWQPVDCSVLSSEGLLFFFLGGWIGDRRLDLKYLRIGSTLVSGAIFFLWLGLCVSQTLWLQGFYRPLAAKVSTPMGVMLLWVLADRVNNLRARKKLLALASYAFFIYALHSPMIRGIYKVLLSLRSEGQYYGLLVYVATPVITITICVLTAELMAQCGGRLCSVLTGGRAPMQNRRHLDAAQRITQPA